MVFSGCTAINCVRQIKGKRTYSSYLIEETCRHAAISECTYPKVRRHEVEGTEPSAQEGVGAASNN
jgi:hypothetical protein